MEAEDRLSIHARMSEFDGPASVENPVAMSKFIQLAKDYIVHAKATNPDSPGYNSAREKATYEKFMVMVKLEHVWPVVQCLADELQHPMKWSPVDGKVFQMMVRQLSKEKPPARVLPTPDEYDIWEQEVYWSRVKASFEYLTFAWEHRRLPTESPMRQKVDERSREARTLAEKFMNMMKQALGDADATKAEREEWIAELCEDEEDYIHSPSGGEYSGDEGEPADT